jgi:nucleotide-binding universal stress UspA family protein
MSFDERRLMRLLIGYDGSAGADFALRDLQRAGLPGEVEAVVLSVADVWMPPDGTRPDPAVAEWLATTIEQAHAERREALERKRAEADHAASALKKQFPNWTVRAEAVGDSPAWGILKYAAEWRPDLIVVGSQGSSALGRIFIGSVAQKVLTTADCSVRVARPHGGEDQRSLKLIVGIDGSVHSARAVRAVEERRWPSGSVVRLVSALDAYLATAVVFHDERIRQWVVEGEAGTAGSWVNRMASAAEKELIAAGLAAEAVVKRGDPKSVLLAEAEAWGADCIFVGAQGLNAVDRLILGSVSSAVAARAHCTVEVVRAGRLAPVA